MRPALALMHKGIHAADTDLDVGFRRTHIRSSEGESIRQIGELDGRQPRAAGQSPDTRRVTRQAEPRADLFQLRPAVCQRARGVGIAVCAARPR